MNSISIGLGLALMTSGPAGLWLSYSFAPSAAASVQAEAARSMVAASYAHVVVQLPGRMRPAGRDVHSVAGVSNRQQRFP
jgi:hypothetical protein